MGEVEVDALQWLEEVDSKEALDWVVSMNDKLPFSGTGSEYERILASFESKDKIPYVGKKGKKFFYNFWKDDKNERGVWRRTTLEEYEKDEPTWETVLDLDQLNKDEDDGANKWVWKGSTYFDDGSDDMEEPTRMLLKLSKGGGDAVVIREFDVVKKRFVPPEENPFYIPESKTSVSYIDDDTLLVGTSFDGEASMTSSGYPRVVKKWTRGTPLAQAEFVFEGEKADVSVSGFFMHERDGIEYQVSRRSIGFYSGYYFVHHVRGLGDLSVTIDKDKPRRLAVQDDADVDFYSDQLLIELRSDWKGFTSGSLLSVSAAVVLQAESEVDVPVEAINALFVPEERSSLKGYVKLRSRILINVLDNMKNKIEFFQYDGETKRWGKISGGATGPAEEKAFNTNDYWAVDGRRSDLFWSTSDGYTTPTTLSIMDATGAVPAKVYKKEKERFDASGIIVQQFEARSEDGTMIPYFQVNHKDTTSKAALLYGYGGFEISLEPHYQVTTGVAWLEKGHTYVCANIRGGGEFGPKWHQAALKENRNKAYEDFEAVAKDLVARGVTTAKQLGCMGGSNGGLLVGNMFTRSPELFGAVICMVPLLDMKRYSKLLAGASWMAEYGDPDTEDWEFLKNYSPYHNISEGKEYPPVLFTTSTRDDRVTPAHARKMARKLVDLGIPNVHYYENVEGGHGGASTPKQRAYMWTLAYQTLYHYIVNE